MKHYNNNCVYTVHCTLPTNRDALNGDVVNLNEINNNTNNNDYLNRATIILFVRNYGTRDSTPTTVRGTRRESINYNNIIIACR